MPPLQIHFRASQQSPFHRWSNRSCLCCMPFHPAIPHPTGQKWNHSSIPYLFLLCRLFHRNSYLHHTFPDNPEIPHSLLYRAYLQSKADKSGCLHFLPYRQNILLAPHSHDNPASNAPVCKPDHCKQPDQMTGLRSDILPLYGKKALPAFFLQSGKEQKLQLQEPVPLPPQ